MLSLLLLLVVLLHIVHKMAFVYHIHFYHDIGVNIPLEVIENGLFIKNEHMLLKYISICLNIILHVCTSLNCI